MASDPNAPRSRRALLAAAAGGAAAMAASAALPLTAAAADGDPVTVGNDFTGTQETSITVTSPALDPQIAFRGAYRQSRCGRVGRYDRRTTRKPPTTRAGRASTATVRCRTTDGIVAAGVWGEARRLRRRRRRWPRRGLRRRGRYRRSTGIGGSGGIGVYAVGDSVDRHRPSRGRQGHRSAGPARTRSAPASRASRSTWPACSGNSRVFAVLHSNRSGRYVRAVVPTTGSFTIYLNTTVTSATYVAWFVLN